MASLFFHMQGVERGLIHRCRSYLCVCVWGGGGVQELNVMLQKAIEPRAFSHNYLAGVSQAYPPLSNLLLFLFLFCGFPNTFGAPISSKR